MRNTNFLAVLITLLLLTIISKGYGQSNFCDPSTPFFSVNLTGFPNGIWTSPAVPRAGNCCGTTPPDKCVEFSITLDSAAVAINFQITSGAIPPGALFYQIGCGPQIQVGSPICLNGPGPYTLTFCKPGNNINEYSITSIAGPAVSPNDTIGDGCSTTMYASGLLVNSSITWNSIYPGLTGAYNSYLSCTSACDSTVVTGNASSPPYVDFQVCGTPTAGVCVAPGLFCDTIRVYFTPPIINVVNPNPAEFCSNTSGVLLTGTVSGGLPPFTYAWTNGANGTGTVVGTGITYTATTAGTYSFIVYDQNYPECPEQITNVSVTVSPAPVINAGPDQAICGTSVTLNGTVTGATGGIWSGGNGTYSPSNTTGNATYTPTAAELNSGLVILTYTSTGNGACSPVSDQVVINISPPITVAISAPSIVCYGELATLTANVTGGIAPYTYLWNTGHTTQTLTNMPAGTYTVTVTGTGGSGCTGTATITIVGNPQIIVTTSPNNSISCSTTAIISASASGGTGTLSYLWSNGATTSSTIVNTGTYTITVTDAVGCSATNSVSVIASNSTLTAVVNQPPVLCFGATTTLTAVANGGFGSYTYSWNTGATTSSIVVGAGNYCVTVTDGGGCVISACVTVSENPELMLNVPTPQVVCNGSTATVTAMVSGGQAPYSYLWSNNQTTQSITALAGNYTVTVTDAIGCNKSASVTISQATPLNVTTTSTPVLCFGANNGTATANVSGGTPNYLYSWSPYGGSSATASNLLTGTYTVTVTDAIGCTQSMSVTVMEPAPLNATVTINNHVSCYNGNDGSATVNPTGGTSPYFYSWSPTGGSGQSATNLVAGNYVISITDINGCSQNVSTTITQPTPLVGSLVSITDVSCNGGNNGSATVSASGGSPGYTYFWSPNGGTNATGVNLTAGSYTVTITDIKGCTTQVTATITEPLALAATISNSTNVSCNGGNNGTATATVTGGTSPYTYVWNTNPVQTSATASNLPIGSYFVTVTDSKGCVTTSSAVTITEPPLLTITASPSSSISCNTTITISASASGGSGAYNYLWNNSATTSSITVGTGTYSVVVTDGNGCTAIDSVSVMASNSTLLVNIPTPANICNGTTTTITANATGGFGGYTYMWNTSAVSSSIIVGAGIYCVTVTDAGGCQANACVTVTQNTPVTASIGTPPIVCVGDSTTITATGSGGQSPYSFLWNTSETTASISKPAGTYTVTVWDVTGSTCSATTTVTITEEPPINISITASHVSCYGGNNGQASAFVSGGMPGYTYSWSPFGGSTSVASNLIPGTYTLVVTDAIGCQSTSTTTITQPLSPVEVTISSNNVTCYGLIDGNATGNATGGYPPYSYYWSPLGVSTPSTSGLSPGTYSITVADSTGCYTTSSVTITEPTELMLSGTTTNANCNNNDGSATVIATGGTTPYTYSWTPSGGNGSTASNLVSGSYTVSVTDSNNCNKQLTLNVLTNPTDLNANFSGTSVCLNTMTLFYDSSTVSNDVISSWSWNFGEPSSGPSNFSSNQNPSHTYSSVGIFNVTLIVTTQIGCTDTITISVTVYTLPVASFNYTPGCIFNLTNFTNTSTISTGSITNVSWNFGDPTSGPNNISNLQNPTHIYNASGPYLVILTVTSNNGCSSTITQNIVIPSLPTVVFSASTVCENQSTQFTDASTISSGSITAWAWNFGDGSAIDTTQNPSHIYANSGTYSVILTVTTSSGCQNTDTMNIVVNPLPNPNFSALPKCLNDTTFFNNTSSISSGTITGWQWNFGDFTPNSSVQSPNHLYTSQGTFTVTLTATSNNGCSSSISIPVSVYALPVGGFLNTTACVGNITQFTDISTVIGDTIISWLWAFGDGSPVNNSQNPGYVYNNQGTYNAFLVVTSNKGCVDTITNSVTVYPTPNVQFLVNDSSGCQNFCTQFSDLSTISSGSITSWIWDFGDNSVFSTIQNPSHCYPESGIYSITLTATSNNNCSATHTEINLINVFPTAIADFSYSPQSITTSNSNVSFTNLSQQSSLWSWNFGDVLSGNDNYSSVFSPEHFYSDMGDYCVTLVASNIYNCTDTTIKCLRVDPIFSFYIPNSFTPNKKDGINDLFSGKGTNFKNYEMWIFDRWGNMIFYTNDIEKKWDGRANGGKNIAQVDVYVYKVVLYDFSETKHEYIGKVTLVR